MSVLSIPPIVMASITFYVGIFHLMLSLRPKLHNEHLTFAATCFAVGLYDVYAAGLYNASSVAEGFPWQRAQLVSLAIATVTLTWFVHDYVSLTVPRWLYAVFTLMILFAMGGLINWMNLFWNSNQPLSKEFSLPWGWTITYHEVAMGPLVQIQSLTEIALALYALWLGAHSYKSRQRKRAWLLVGALCALLLGAVNDLAVSGGLYKFIYIFEYAFTAMVMSMTYSLSDTVVRAAEMQATLVQERSLLRTLIDNLPDHVYVKDLTGRKTLANHSEVLFMGAQSEAEALGKTDRDIYPADLAARYRADDQHVMQTGQPLLNREEPVPDAAGRLHWLLTSKLPLRDESGIVVGLVGIGRDITERREAQQELVENEARYHSLFEGSPISLWEEDFSQVKKQLDDLRSAGVLEIRAYLIEHPEIVERLSALVKILDINQATLRLFGAQSKAELYAGLNLVFTSESNEVFREELVALAQGRTHFASESVHRTLSGDRIHVALSTSVAPGYEEDWGKVFVSILDITERKQVEQALQETSERRRALEQIINSSPAVAFLWRTEEGWPVEYVSDSVRQFGYAPEDFAGSGLHYASIIYPDDLPNVARLVRLYNEQGSNEFTQEYRIITRSGQTRWVDDRTWIARAPNGAALYHQGIILDITERKHSEVERERLLIDLAHYGTQLQTASEISKSAITILEPELLMRQAVKLIQERFDFYYVGIFLVDPTEQHAVLQAGTGEAGRQMLVQNHRLAIGSNSMIGWCIANTQARIALDVGAEAVRFDNPLLPRTRSEMALPLLTRGRAIGALTVQSARAAAFSDEDIAALQTMADQLATAIENARLYAASQQEIARRMEAEERVGQLNEDLEQRVIERTAQLQAVTHELESFAYSVSHDLKAPLRGIDGYSRLLLEDHRERLNEEGQYFLQTIRRATEQMNQLIDDLLSYSRLERRSFTTGEINLRALVEAVLGERSDELLARKISAALNLACESVRADAAGLSQALRNLVDNAIKFTRDRPEARIEIGARETQNACILWVRDNGIGFDMQYHDRLFEIFQRLHRIEDYPGTGIGLAIVRKAAQRMGGRAWAESAPGAGATFFLEIPK